MTNSSWPLFRLGLNPYGMTYYLGFCLLIFGIVQFIEAFKNKNLVGFSKKSLRGTWRTHSFFALHWDSISFM